MSRVTTLSAPMTAPASIVTLGMTTTFCPSQLRPMRTGAISQAADLAYRHCGVGEAVHVVGDAYARASSTASSMTTSRTAVIEV